MRVQAKEASGPARQAAADIRELAARLRDLEALAAGDPLLGPADEQGECAGEGGRGRVGGVRRVEVVACRVRVCVCVGG